MVHVERSFDVSKSPAVVIEYLQDFARAEQWDPGTKRCDRLDDGPVRVGSRWHNVSEFRGRETELEYELMTLTPNRLVFRGRNKTATSTDDIRVDAAGAGSRLTYAATIEFHGLARLAGPFLSREFERLGDATQARLVEVIDGLDGPAAAS